MGATYLIVALSACMGAMHHASWVPRSALWMGATYLIVAL